MFIYVWLEHISYNFQHCYSPGKHNSSHWTESETQNKQNLGAKIDIISNCFIYIQTIENLKLINAEKGWYSPGHCYCYVIFFSLLCRSLLVLVEKIIVIVIVLLIVLLFCWSISVGWVPLPLPAAFCQILINSPCKLWHLVPNYQYQFFVIPI